MLVTKLELAAAMALPISKGCGVLSRRLTPAQANELIRANSQSNSRVVRRTASVVAPNSRWTPETRQPHQQLPRTRQLRRELPVKANGLGMAARSMSTSAMAAPTYETTQARKAYNIAPAVCSERLSTANLSPVATTAADFLLPFDLVDTSSVHTQKVINLSSSYLTHSLLDINTNGYVTACELQSGLKAIGLHLSDRQMETLLDRYDDNPRNGVLERVELVPFFDHLKLHLAVGSAAKVLRGVEAHAFFMGNGAVAGGRSVQAVNADQAVYENVKDKCSMYLTYALFDKCDDGFITPEELKSGLKSLAQLEATDEQLDLLFRRYDDNNNGVLEPTECTPLFDDLKKYKSVTSLLSADSYERVFGACSKYLTYTMFEKDDEGFITPEELKSGLSQLGKKRGIVSRMELTDAEVDEIMLRYDDNNNNVLEPEEVAVFLDDFFSFGNIDSLLASPPPSATSNNLPWTVNQKLLSYTSAYLTHAILDTNFNGHVTLCELKAGMRALGVRMSDHQFDAVLERYDENRNSVFEREELEPLFDDLKIHILLCGYP